MITLLTGQHRDVEVMFDELEDVSGEASEEALVLARRVVISLVLHSVAEEIHLYPTVRDRLEGGDALADKEIAEHDEAELTMKQLELLRPDDGKFWPVLARLRDEVRQHVDEEESELFPRLREACSPEQLQALGVRIERSERFAPTRPHPKSPSEGTPLALLAPGAGLVDRIRDAASGRGR